MRPGKLADVTGDTRFRPLVLRRTDPDYIHRYINGHGRPERPRSRLEDKATSWTTGM